MVSIFVHESLNEPFENSRRARFQELMFMTRRFPVRRPAPLPNAKSGIIVLGVVGVLLSLAGLWYCGMTIHNFVAYDAQSSEVEHRILTAHTNEKKSPHTLRNFASAFLDVEKTFIYGIKGLHKVDAEGVKLYGVATAMIIAALIGFSLATMGAWMDNPLLLFLSLPILILAVLLEVAASVMDTNSDTVHLFEGRYSTTILVFTFLFITVMWVLTWLHHRSLTFAFSRQHEKFNHHTPLNDNVQ